jgi:hypothetical protein
VRFWGEPPLVREPDITLFGIDRLDPGEQELLGKSPLRHVLAVDIQAKGAAAAAKDALTHLHADTREFVLHLDLDVVSSDDLSAVNVPGSGGLTFAEVRTAFMEFARHKNLLGFDVAQFNPGNDPDGSSARKVVDLLVAALSARLESTEGPAAPDASSAEAEPAESPVTESPATQSSAGESAAEPAHSDAASTVEPAPSPGPDAEAPENAFGASES